MAGIALILDPRMKKDFLQNVVGWTDDWIKIVEEHFKSAFQFYKNNIPVGVSTEVTNTTSLSGAYSRFITNKRLRVDTPSRTDFTEEFVRYLFPNFRYFNAPLESVESDILPFWKANALNYPILAAMAKDYLTVQTSSVSAERAFSSGTDLVTADRCSLRGETIEMTQFLKFAL